MHLRKVLFPEPDEPIMLITFPGRALKETPLRTSCSPYRLCKFSTLNPFITVLIYLLRGVFVEVESKRDISFLLGEQPPLSPS